MTALDPSEKRQRYRNWARIALTIVAGLLALLCLLVAVLSFEKGGWNNERTILYAAEGGVISPRERLMYGLIFGAAMLIWSVVFVATMAYTATRARRIFRATASGVVIELALGAVAGGLCGDMAGFLVLSATLALPMAILALMVRRWGGKPTSSR
jgi:Mn2+/Fe2+ NRAMP family transporter